MGETAATAVTTIPVNRVPAASDDASSPETKEVVLQSREVSDIHKDDEEPSTAVPPIRVAMEDKSSPLRLAAKLPPITVTEVAPEATKLTFTMDET